VELEIERGKLDEVGRFSWFLETLLMKIEVLLWCCTRFAQVSPELYKIFSKLFHFPPMCTRIFIKIQFFGTRSSILVLDPIPNEFFMTV
jgi:hypothetical protein